MNVKSHEGLNWGCTPKVNWLFHSHFAEWDDPLSLRRSPRTKISKRWVKKLEVFMGINASSGGGNRFEEEVAVSVKDVVSVGPKMVLADEDTGESASKLTR